jgi:hypothetical protein
VRVCATRRLGGWRSRVVAVSLRRVRRLPPAVVVGGGGAVADPLDDGLVDVSELVTCGCEDATVDQGTVDVAALFGQEVELACGHTVAPPPVVGHVDAGPGVERYDDDGFVDDREAGCPCAIDQLPIADRDRLDAASDRGVAETLPCGHDEYAAGFADHLRRVPTIAATRTTPPADQRSWDHNGLVSAAADQLPTRRARTARGAARQERRAVTRLVDERVPFEQLGSLTDRARLRDQVLADLAAARQSAPAPQPAGARESGRGWSL